MALQETIAAQGNWLFRYRSFVPVPIFLAALYLALEMAPPGANADALPFWDLICLAVATVGLLVRVLTAGFVPAGTSGRNTSAGQVADALNTTGLYSLVRNPLYLGNFLLSLGAVMYAGVWWFSALYVAIFYFYYERIIFAEESFLRSKFGQPYLDWAARTPMLVPRLSGWNSPPLTFSLPVVIRQETATTAAMVVTFTLLEVLQGYSATGALNQPPGWLWACGIVLAAHIVVTLIVRKTSLLAAPERRVDA